jgi:CheY-like chemotaxis protein
MALRVLLADESVTIKKVFQLALQDYGVEVMSVHLGVDVVTVAKTFKPDIVFADVLLQKMNGYEVTKALKATPEFKNTPIVLIWSNFLELDQAKFKDCGASDHLEKPFDTDRLREVIQKLVPKTNTQKLSSYLNFPKMPDFVDPSLSAKANEPQELNLAPLPPPTKPVPQAPNPSDWNMDQFAALETPDDFIQLDLDTPLPLNTKPMNESLDGDENDSQWVQKSLSKYKLDPTKIEPPTEAVYNLPDEAIELDIDQLTAKPAALKTPSSKPLPQAVPSSITAPSINSTLSKDEIREIVRQEAQKLLEKVIWEVVPELATQIIERELKRVMQETNEPV